MSCFSWNWVAYYIGGALLGDFFLPVVPIAIDSQLGDIADEHEIITGNRTEGIIFSLRIFGMKMTRGIGGRIGTFGLE